MVVTKEQLNKCSITSKKGLSNKYSGCTRQWTIDGGHQSFKRIEKRIINSPKSNASGSRVVTAFSLFTTNERYRASWAGHTLYQIQIMGHGEKD